MNTSPLSILSTKICQSPSFQEGFQLARSIASKKRIGFTNTTLESRLLKRLILQMSLISMSPDFTHKSISKKFASILYDLNLESPEISYAIQILSARVGNFPILRIERPLFGDFNILSNLENHNLNSLQIDPEIISDLYTEESQALTNIANRNIYLNVFQREIFEALSSKQLVSFSAPTSFGKSFIVRQFIIKKYIDKSLTSALIVVPTKSLIDDYFNELSTLRLQHNFDFKIITHSRSNTNVEGPKIFVLTQERLIYLLDNSPTLALEFGIIYFDEAHNVSRGYRGFVYRTALSKLIDLFDQSSDANIPQYIFSSPLINNPNYYRDNFFESYNEDDCFHEQIHFSPVDKNIYLVGKNEADYTYQLHIEDYFNLYDTPFVDIGNRRFSLELLNRGFDNNRDFEIARDIDIVLNNISNRKSILYTTTPIAAHRYGLELASHLSRSDRISESEIMNLNQYISDHFDPIFQLVELLQMGVGLHYGKMPVGLRRIIVALFESGKIDYLVCTSTLLEGVNLPAKNIFLFSNKHHHPYKHTSLSFWNLVGRAGRLTYGLSGNLFCISKQPNKYKELLGESDASISDPERDISDNSTKLSHLATSILNFEQQFDYITSTNRNDIEFLLFELITSDNSDLILNRMTNIDEFREELAANLEIIKTGLNIPSELLMMNPGIDPRSQNALYNFLSHSDGNLQHFIDLISNPLAISEERISGILAIINETLLWPNINSYDRVAQLAKRLTQWLHELPISAFLSNYLRHHQNASQLDKIDKALNFLGRLETDLSFSAPKYFKCFFDILTYLLNTNDEERTRSNSDKIDFFLFSVESGVSSRIAKYLHECGVERTIAIKANDIIRPLSQDSIEANFFLREDIRDLLKNGLSTIAFDDIYHHINN